MKLECFFIAKVDLKNHETTRRGPKPNGNELIYPNETIRFQDKKQ